MTNITILEKKFPSLQYEEFRDRSDAPACWVSTILQCPLHFHSCIELVYMTKGEMVAYVDGKTLQLSQDDLLLVPSYALHQYTTTETAKALLLILPTDFIPSVKKMLHKQSFSSLTCHMEKGNKLRECLESLSHHLQNKQENPLLTKGYIYIIMGILVEVLGLSPQSKKNVDNFSRDVLLYIDQNFTGELSAGETAKHFGYSKSHFMHLFSTAFGFGFNEYINIQRCRHAAMLLRHEARPLIDISLEVGFNNLRSFYRNFKKVFHQTPTEFINHPKQEHHYHP